MADIVHVAHACMILVTEYGQRFTLTRLVGNQRRVFFYAHQLICYALRYEFASKYQKFQYYRSPQYHNASRWLRGKY